VSGLGFPHTKFFTRFVACPTPSSPGLYQLTASSGPDPYSLSERSSLVTPIDPRARQGPVEPVFAVTRPTRSLALETANEVDPPRYRSWGKPPMLVASAEGTCSELVPQVVGLSAVVVFAEAAALVVEAAVAAAVAVDSGEIGDLNHSVVT